MTLWQETLQRLVALVDAKIAEADASAGAYDSKNYDAWRARNQQADDRLIAVFSNDEDARFTVSGAHEHAVRLAGIRATSTSGYRAALRNWQTAARRRMEREAVK